MFYLLRFEIQRKENWYENRATGTSFLHSHAIKQTEIEIFETWDVYYEKHFPAFTNYLRQNI